MKNDDAFTIRSYQPSDREAVRRLCCQTGFLGEAIDPVYEDRELFADFLTTVERVAEILQGDRRCGSRPR